MIPLYNCLQTLKKKKKREKAESCSLQRTLLEAQVPLCVPDVQLSVLSECLCTQMNRPEGRRAKGKVWNGTGHIWAVESVQIKSSTRSCVCVYVCECVCMCACMSACVRARVWSMYIYTMLISKYFDFAIWFCLVLYSVYLTSIMLYKYFVLVTQERHARSKIVSSVCANYVHTITVFCSNFRR